MKTEAKVIVNNVPDDALQYIVCRFLLETLELWYWGSWNDKKKAEEIALGIGGIVVERLEDGI